MCQGQAGIEVDRGAQFRDRCIILAAQGLNPAKRVVGQRFLVVEGHGLLRELQCLVEVFKRGVDVGDGDLDVPSISKGREGLREIRIQVDGASKESTCFGHVLDVDSP